MAKLSFDDVPNLLTEILQKQERLERLIIQSKKPSNETKKRWLNLQELMSYHPDKPARQTVYGWVSNGQIPYHKTGKKLRFLKSEIDKWLLDGRRVTLPEMEADAANYLK